MANATKGKPAGSRASNGYGDFQVKFCSPAQARFSQRLIQSSDPQIPLKNRGDVFWPIKLKFCHPS